MGGLFSSCAGSRATSVAQSDDGIALGPVMRSEALQPVQRDEDDYRIPIHWSPFAESPLPVKEDVASGGEYGDDDYP